VKVGIFAKKIDSLDKKTLRKILFESQRPMGCGDIGTRRRS